MIPGVDLKRRIICIGDLENGEETEINQHIAFRVILGLEAMQHVSRPVKFYINSFGGEDDAARAIIGAMRDYPNKIHGVVYGRAESAAAWILQHCHTRTMMSHSSLMLHLGSGATTKHAKYIDKLFIEDVLRRMHEKLPDYPRSKLVAHLHEDWYVYPSQALELGLADIIK